MELKLLELASDAPWVAVCGYLLWRLTSQESKLLDAFRQGAESHRDLAMALQTLTRLENGHEQTARLLTQIKTEIRELKAEIR